MRAMLNRISYFILIIILVLPSWQSDAQNKQPEKEPQNENSFEMAKQLEIYVSLFKELNAYYVNEINPADLVKTSIDAMLKTLDPYTVYYPESEIEDARFLTTGNYGGIGAVITKRGDYVQITEPYEGSPAIKYGLMAGDVIKEVDGKSIKGLATDEVTALLKGQPDTEVKLLIERNNGTEKLNINIIRGKIQIPNVPYFCMLENNIGYVILSGFKENSTEDIKDAITKIQEKGQMKGLIFDLRGNPGGLLIEAVRLAGLFVDKGQLIVSTKGKVASWNKEYKTYESPISTDLPLIFLIDEGSASASEILSGAMQDLDRAVIMGKRSLGKGLVQTPRPLPYNSQMKVTTAKYYIPSGRCIQEIDYAHKGTDGKAVKVADSLISKFFTKNGRPVYDGKGIFPDIETKKDTLPEIINYLTREFVIFDFATKYRLEHDSIAAPDLFVLSKQDYDDFVAFAKSKQLNYQTSAEKSLNEFRQKAEKEKNFDLVKADFDTMMKKIEEQKINDLYRYQKDIQNDLTNEIVSRYYYQKGRIIQSMKTDNDIMQALQLLDDTQSIDNILMNKQ